MQTDLFLSSALSGPRPKSGQHADIALFKGVDFARVMRVHEDGGAGVSDGEAIAVPTAEPDVEDADGEDELAELEDEYAEAGLGRSFPRDGEDARATREHPARESVKTYGDQPDRILPGADPNAGERGDIASLKVPDSALTERTSPSLRHRDGALPNPSNSTVDFETERVSEMPRASEVRINYAKGEAGFAATAIAKATATEARNVNGGRSSEAERHIASEDPASPRTPVARLSELSEDPRDVPGTPKPRRRESVEELAWADIPFVGSNGSAATQPGRSDARAASPTNGADPMIPPRLVTEGQQEPVPGSVQGFGSLGSSVQTPTGTGDAGVGFDPAMSPDVPMQPLAAEGKVAVASVDQEPGSAVETSNLHRPNEILVTGAGRPAPTDGHPAVLRTPEQMDPAQTLKIDQPQSGPAKTDRNTAPHPSAQPVEQLDRPGVHDRICETRAHGPSSGASTTHPVADGASSARLGVPMPSEPASLRFAPTSGGSASAETVPRADDALRLEPATPRAAHAQVRKDGEPVAAERIPSRPATPDTPRVAAPLVKTDAPGPVEWTMSQPASDPASAAPRDPIIPAQNTHHAAAQQAAVARDVAQQLSLVTRAAPGEVTELSLRPDELGQVRMRLSGGDGQIVLQIMSERPETHDLMRRHIDIVERAFRDLGYSDISFDFSFAGQRRDADQLAAEHADPAPGAEEVPQPETVRAQRPTLVQGRLDIRL